MITKRDTSTCLICGDIRCQCDICAGRTPHMKKSVEALYGLCRSDTKDLAALLGEKTVRKYDEVKGTARSVLLTQRLAKLHETKQLKEQVDAAQ